MHEGTRFALSDYSLNGQTLEILSAYSAAEGRTLMRAHPDIAAVLLDVIMETDAAGLDLVEYIRNELKNETVRIILRTGQPGQAPERRVIVQYDINDYKAKTELTADKLFTSLTAALRSYQQLERMVQTRRGLEIIIDAASTLYDFKSMQRLAEGVLTQIASLLNVDCAGILVLRDGGVVGDDFSVLAGSGCYSRFIGAAGSKSLDPDLRSMVEAAFRRRKHEFVDHRTVLYIRTGSGREVVVLLQAERQLSETDRSLVEIFGSRLSIAFDNVILYQQLHEANTQLEDRVAQRTRALMQANRRLSAQWLRLQRANGFKNEILGTVAHDLKNPLGVILGRTEMLTELIGAGSSRESVTAQVEHIRDATRRLTSMVDHLISDAMADAFDITHSPRAGRYRRLVGEVADANQPLAVNKQQAITRFGAAEFQSPCATPTGCGKRSTISSAMPSSTVRSAARSRCWSSDEKNNTVIRIADEGAGLSPEDLGRLFGRFQRLSAKPTAGESSTGLGLSIVKRIIDMHGGEVTADSAGPGQGSTFTVVLPATERHDDMTQSPHIIIVDDEAPAREMVGDYLKMHGFTVTLCDGGKSLRGAIETAVPDLVVLDLNMPEEDGLSIIRDLKSRTNVPVIMLTATASPIDRVVGLELGADDYVAKPCELRELMARIRSVLRRSSPVRAQAATPEAAGAKAGERPVGAVWDQMARPRGAGAARRRGQRASADRFRIRTAQGFRRESEAGAVARAPAGTGQCARQRSLRSRRRSANHANPAQDRTGPDQTRGDPHHPRRRISVLARRRQGLIGWIRFPRPRRERCGDCSPERFRAKACTALDAGWIPVRVRKTGQLLVRPNEQSAPPPELSLITVGSSVQVSFVTVWIIEPAAPSAITPAAANVALTSLASRPFRERLLLSKVNSQLRIGDSDIADPACDGFGRDRQIPLASLL